MKPVATYFLAAVLSVGFTASLSAQTTQKLTANKSNDYGLIYNLPLTSIGVVVEAEREVKNPGDFFRYAKKYLNMDPVKSRVETWSIKSVSITTQGVPDTKESYLVQFKAGATPTMIVDANSFPLAVNDDSFEMPPATAIPAPQAPKPTILETPAAAQAMTQDMLQSQSSAKRAELAAAKIYELRQSRNDIISGQADQMPADGKAMQLALDNLSSQEEALTAMFVGTTQTSTDVEVYDWMFDGSIASKTRVVVGRLSQVDGLVDADDLSGEPIYLEVEVAARGELPVNDKGEEKKFPKGGLAYCVPGEANVSVVYNGRTLASKRVQVAQLGVVFGLDPTMFTDKKAPAYVHFDPSTGSVVEIGSVQ